MRISTGRSRWGWSNSVFEVLLSATSTIQGILFRAGEVLLASLLIAFLRISMVGIEILLVR